MVLPPQPGWGRWYLHVTVSLLSGNHVRSGAGAQFAASSLAQQKAPSRSKRYRCVNAIPGFRIGYFDGSEIGER